MLKLSGIPGATNIVAGIVAHGAATDQAYRKDGLAMSLAVGGLPITAETYNALTQSLDAMRTLESDLRRGHTVGGPLAMAGKLALAGAPLALSLAPLFSGAGVAARALPQFSRSTIDDVVASSARMRGQVTEGARANIEKAWSCGVRWN